MKLAPDTDFLLALRSIAFDAAKRKVDDRHAVLDVNRTRPPSLEGGIDLHPTACVVHLVLATGEPAHVHITYAGVAQVLPVELFDAAEECEDTIDLEAEYEELRAAGHDDGRARELMGQVA